MRQENHLELDSRTNPDEPQACAAAMVDGEVDLERILSAWNSATERLQQTHKTLRDEVKRLTDELELKNRELARKNRLADLGQMASHIAHSSIVGSVHSPGWLSCNKRD